MVIWPVLDWLPAGGDNNGHAALSGERRGQESVNLVEPDQTPLCTGVHNGDRSACDGDAGACGNLTLLLSDTKP
jgi:hypothetical protein